MELLLLGERKTAQELLALGLVNRVVPGAEMLDVALGIAKRSRWSSGRLKTLLNGELGTALWRAVETEQTTPSRPSATRILRSGSQDSARVKEAREGALLSCAAHHAVPIAPGLRLGSPKNGNISYVGWRLSAISP
jgi:enoyl-CoA hydratase/carnithine racemase